MEKKSQILLILGLVAILFLLIATLFPFEPNRALTKSKKLQTVNDAMGLQQAISNFYSEFSELPKLGSPTITTEGPDGQTLLKVLLGTESGTSPLQNPRGITFLPSTKANKHKSKGGLVYRDPDSRKEPEGLYDAWGSPFHVIFDHDYDNKIADPLFPGNVVLNKPAIIYSCGPDKKPGGGDDIKTW